MTFVFALIFLLVLWGIYMTSLLIKQIKKVGDWAKRIEGKRTLVRLLKLQIDAINHGKKEETEKR